MKKVEKNKVKDIFEQYKYTVLLVIIIFILFLISGYSTSDINYTVYVNENKANIKYGIYTKNNEQYIHLEDLESIFKDNVYDDKISGKLIITTYNKLVKINKTDENYAIKVDNKIYFNLLKLMEQMGNKVIISKDYINITNLECVEGKIQTNRTELWDKWNHSVLCFLNKKDNVQVYIDQNVQSDDKQFVTVKAYINDNIYYGYILKKNITFEYQKEEKLITDDKLILARSDNKLAVSTDTKIVDVVTMNMYRLAGVDILKKLDYINNIPKGIKIVATINNGQKSSNYDVSILTGMLNSESNRQKIIQQIEKYVKDIAGVNLDFSDFKVSDKDYYTQFVKELSAVMHSNNKIVLVNVPSTQYIDVQEISKFADYIIIQPYAARTIASKTSGPISSLAYVEQKIKQVISQVKNVDKIILEIPAYTILWTERRGTVINAEQYNMKVMQEYLNENNITYELDNTSGQNYINYTKGITTYKMWLEDSYSINQKTMLASKYNLAGISIYKSGMELKEIYTSISKILNK